MVAQDTASVAGNINKLINAMETLRSVHQDMTLNQVLVLLTVAANEGITQKQVVDLMGLTDGSVARIVAILSKYGNRGTGPFNLIDMRIDDADRRQRALFLTPEGRRLVNSIVRSIR